MIMSAQSNLSGEDILNHKLIYVDREISIHAACRLMRSAGMVELLVTERENGQLRPIGILTASDIVCRVIAAGLDPAVMTAGDIAWSGTTDEEVTAGDAERLLRYRDLYQDAFAVMDADNQLIATVRLEEFIGASSRTARFRATDESASNERRSRNMGRTEGESARAF